MIVLRDGRLSVQKSAELAPTEPAAPSVEPEAAAPNADVAVRIPKTKDYIGKASTGRMARAAPLVNDRFAAELKNYGRDFEIATGWDASHNRMTREAQNDPVALKAALTLSEYDTPRTYDARELLAKSSAPDPRINKALRNLDRTDDAWLGEFGLLRRAQPTGSNAMLGEIDGHNLLLVTWLAKMEASGEGSTPAPVMARLREVAGRSPDLRSSIRATMTNDPTFAAYIRRHRVAI